jgi:hypothetical protein
MTRALECGTTTLFTLVALAAFSGSGCGLGDEPVAASQEKLLEAQKRRAESLKGEAGQPPKPAALRSLPGIR